MNNVGLSEKRSGLIFTGFPPEIRPEVHEVKHSRLFSTTGTRPGTFLRTQELRFDLSYLTCHIRAANLRTNLKSEETVDAEVLHQSRKKQEKSFVH